MLAILSLNLFSLNSEHVSTFKESEEVIRGDKSKSLEEKVAKAKDYFKDFVLSFELNFDDSKYSYNINTNLKTMDLSYFNADNSVEYVANISY